MAKNSKKNRKNNTEDTTLNNLLSKLNSNEDIQQTQPDGLVEIARLEERVKALEEKNTNRLTYLIGAITVFVVLFPLYYTFMFSTMGNVSNNTHSINNIAKKQTNMSKDIQQNKMYIHDQKYKKLLLHEICSKQKIKNSYC